MKSPLKNLPGIARVSLGQVMPSPTVNRCDVADGTKGRCILLSDDWFCVSVAFTETPVRGGYFVTQEQALRYSLPARNYYMAVVARLDTDARGEIISPEVRIEYLRLSEDVYREFADLALEQPFDSVALTKVTKGQFSYVKPVPSSKKQNPKLLKQVKDKIANYNFDDLAKMALIGMARPFSDYLKALREAGEDVDIDEEPEVKGNLPKSLGSAPKAPKQITEAEEVEAEEVEFSDDNDEFAEGSDENTDEFAE